MRKLSDTAICETSCPSVLMADFISPKDLKALRSTKGKTLNNRTARAFRTIIIILILMIVVDSSYSQSLNDYEKRYEKLNIQLEKENRILDSMQNIFSYKTSLIDIEKEKKNPDNEKVIDLMAGSVATSNKIEEQNKKINRIGNEIENVKKHLHDLYTVRIDSLELLRKTGNEDDVKLDAEILYFTGKNILVAPRILSLSFNPEKILDIDLNQTEDPKEKKLYKEYLDNALNEVNSLLGTVSQQISEVRQIVALQIKTKKFLEDAELESNMIIQSQRNQPNETETIARLDGGITEASSDFAANVKNYQVILRQLDIQQLSKTELKLKLSFEDINRRLDIKEYQKLLKEVKERLQEFKLVLANKTGYSE